MGNWEIFGHGIHVDVNLFKQRMHVLSCLIHSQNCQTELRSWTNVKGQTCTKLEIVVGKLNCMWNTLAQSKISCQYHSFAVYMLCIVFIMDKLHITFINVFLLNSQGNKSVLNFLKHSITGSMYLRINFR